MAGAAPGLGYPALRDCRLPPAPLQARPPMRTSFRSPARLAAASLVAALLQDFTMVAKVNPAVLEPMKNALKQLGVRF